MYTKRMKRLAVFDIDGTLFRSSLLIEVTNALIAEGVFPASARTVYQQAYENWLNRKDEYGEYIAAVIVAFEKHIRGVRRTTFLRVVRKVTMYQKHRVYRYTRDLIRRLQKRGYFLLVISHSPADMVAAFTKQWGFHKAYGRVLELRNGKYTGKVLFSELIDNKAKILKLALAQEGLTLRGSLAVGDSEGDIPMLKLVDRPICFNPNGILYRQAKRAGWKVVVERKDVVYQL